MSALHAIAVLMVWVECLTAHWSLNGRAMPLLLAVAAGVAGVSPWRWNPGWVPRRVLAIVIAGTFLLWWRVGLRDADPMYVNIAFGNNMAYAFGLHFVAIQVCQLVMRHPNGLPIHFPLLGLGAMVFAGDAFPRMARANDVYFGCSLAFALLACLYYDRCRPRAAAGAGTPWSRRAWMAVALALAAALAAGTAATLRWAETRVQQLLVGAMAISPYETLGGSAGSTLYGVQLVRRRDADRIALRIHAEATPPYLRSRAFVDYQPPRWVDARDAGAVRPTRPPTRAGEDAMFPVMPTDAGALCVVEVLPDPAIETQLFTPLGTAWLAMRAPLVRVDPSGVVSVPHGAPGRPYRAHFDEGGGPRTLSDEARAAHLRLPDHLDPRFREKAAELCGHLEDPRAKMAAIVAWLDRHRDYGTGFRAPDGEDPLTHFLFGDPPQAGHCELFASAAVLLLRAAGVPARYVTGVAPWERSRIGDYWIARNRDAHAWAEAFDPGVGWAIVEATPALGVPGPGTGAPAPWWSEAAYQANLMRVRVFAALRQGDFRGAAAVLGEALRDAAALTARAWWIWLPGAAAAAAWVLRARILKRLPRLPRRGPRPAPEDRARLAAIRRVDRAARRAGLARAAAETPHQFAARIESDAPWAVPAAAWYRAFGAARYGGREDAVRAAIADARSAARAFVKPRPR